MVDIVMIFFFNDTATTEIYTYGHTLSRHDALPICERQLVASGGPGPAIAAAQRRIPRADGVPPVFDPVVPDGGGDGGLARLRADPQPVDARPDRPGRGAAVLLRRAFRRLPGRPAAAAQARHGRVPGAGDHAAAARGDPRRPAGRRPRGGPGPRTRRGTGQIGRAPCRAVVWQAV